MANLTTSLDLLQDVLFRAGEPSDGSSDWQAQAMSYLNRAYRAIYQGGAEFSPEINEAWWWLLSPTPGVLILRPPVTAEVAFTQDMAGITFSAAPAGDYAGWWLTVEAHEAAFRVTTHGVGELAAILDAPWTGDTGTVTATLRQLEHTLPVDLLRLVAPMRGPGGHEVHLVELDGIETRWPRHDARRGVPDYFAPIGERRVRFSSLPERLTRLEFDFLRRPEDLINDETQEPIMPREYRHLIADGALYFVNVDKNDNRADTAGLLVKAGLKAMQREHRHRMIRQNPGFGQLAGRPNLYDPFLTTVLL